MPHILLTIYPFGMAFSLRYNLRCDNLLPIFYVFGWVPVVSLYLMYILHITIAAKIPILQAVGLIVRPSSISCEGEKLLIYACEHKEIF